MAAVAKKMLSSVQVAEEIGVEKKTVDRWRKQTRPDGTRKGPPFHDIEGVIRYSLEDVRQYLLERKVTGDDGFEA